jgi:alpha-1,3-fucosyltransferase
VLGGADYSQLLPQKSYINAFNFESPYHLAKFLHEIGSNEKLYNKYFEWKNEYEIIDTDPNWSSFCSLCAKLAKSKTLSIHSSSYLSKWWFDSGNCTKLNTNLINHFN